MERNGIVQRRRRHRRQWRRSEWSAIKMIARNYQMGCAQQKRRRKKKRKKYVRSFRTLTNTAISFCLPLLSFFLSPRVLIFYFRLALCDFYKLVSTSFTLTEFLIATGRVIIIIFNIYFCVCEWVECALLLLRALNTERVLLWSVFASQTMAIGRRE